MRTELVRRRNQLEMTHDVIADKANISRPYYTNIEAGRKDPSFKVMKRIADVLETTVDSIFFDQDVPNRNMKSTAIEAN
ncbi:helix-turn-helix transcriptional regulator [Paenibacillus sp. UNC451MF]|uniref:helix-turn-helix transcriptional regulator n=1 Tax=Paenibacillus sp. UNC451MF TaxID=1449063 RepID=UPI00048C7DCD|nr:helix-turn-helix transcriptional regulator [Paenibacillus sp. UNC451MF]